MLQPQRQQLPDLFQHNPLCSSARRSNLPVLVPLFEMSLPGSDMNNEVIVCAHVVADRTCSLIELTNENTGRQTTFLTTSNPEGVRRHRQRQLS